MFFLEIGVGEFFYGTFDIWWLFVLCRVLVKSLKEDWGKDPRSWTHVIYTLTRQLEWLMLIISLLNFHPNLYVI